MNKSTVASARTASSTRTATAALDYPTSSTSSTGKDILFFSTEAASPYSETAHDVALQIRDESNWRWNYHHHVIRNMEICTESSDACLAVAQAGLDRLYDTFRYQGTSLKNALTNNHGINDESSLVFETGKIVGTGQLPSTIDGNNNTDNHNHLKLPIGKDKNKRNTVLYGADVIQQLDDWARVGVVEPDTAEAIRNLTRQDLNLQLSDWVFVVMGAGAAMGPLQTLLSLGAHVIAIDLPIPAVWERLMTLAKSSPGTLSFPMTRRQHTTTATTAPTEKEMTVRAGCNLLTQINELRDWLIYQCPDKRLVLGSYAYLDSSAFVRVSLAMDAVASGCLEARPNSALAYLCSPTDCFAIPHAAREASNQNYRDDIHHHDILQRLMKCFDTTDTRFLQPNIAGQQPQLPLVDAMVLQQGPNYYLAKRLQHWRAMVAKYEHGAVVSSNVAPASNTQSVLKNKLLAAAYAGANHIKPIRIFDPETSNVLMTYLLLHDLKEQSTNGRGAGGLKVDHPLNIFATTPVHNGIWRCGYQIRSLLELVVAYYFLEKYQPRFFLAMAVGAAGVGAARFTSNL
mmetsp:Transcript_14501/g.20456  ORF Transcript_14501/g.20456 Transcript_14501/m.20456 type:complete len:571 (-) Transcript_14501:35-1747(-)